MRFFLTGGSGFIGSHIAEILSREGHEVVALVRKSSKTAHLEKLRGVRLAYGSVEDRASLDAAVEGVDAVIHGAGLVKARSRDEFHACNVAGTTNLLDAVKKNAPKLRRFVLISSQAATAPSPDGTPVKNDVEPRPVTSYGWSKLEAERAAKAAAKDLPITIIRPPMVYGPRDPESFQLFQAADRRVLPQVGDPNGKLSLIFGPDCARACVLAAEKDGVPSGNAYFVTDGHVYTRKEMAEQLERAVGKKALVSFPIPNAIVRSVARVGGAYGKLTNKPVFLTPEKAEEVFGQWVCDGSDAERDLGFQAEYPWRRGAEVTARWYRENGWL